MMLLGELLFEKPFLNRSERNLACQYSLLRLHDVGCACDGGQFCYRLMVEDVLRRYSQACMVRSRGNSQTEYRVAAELEKIVVNADTFDAEQLPPQIGD